MTEIKDYQDNNTNIFILFSFLFGFYITIDSFYIYKQAGETWILFTPFLSIYLMLKPSSLSRFLIVSFASFIGIWTAFPSHSNSTFLTFILTSLILISFICLMLEKKTFKISSADLYACFAPGGRILLITLYFYGVFQKINTGFINPDFSCATTLMNYFWILPQWLINHPYIQYSAIYGTFIIEGIIALFIIFPKTRYWGIIIGVLFHIMLSMNGYKYYQPFTILTILLHFLYLEPNVLHRFTNSRIGKFFQNYHKRAFVLLITVGLFATTYALAWHAGLDIYNQTVKKYTYMIWLPAGITILLFILIYVRPNSRNQTTKPDLRYFISQNPIVNIIVLIYFLQCLSPYVGLKTEQALNMYSNLRVTENYSNHYLIQRPLPLFPYMNDTVKVLSSDSTYLQNIIKNNEVIFAIDFFDYLARQPKTSVVYIYKGQAYNHYHTSDEQIHEWKRPYLAYKLLSSKPYPADIKNLHCSQMHE